MHAIGFSALQGRQVSADEPGFQGNNSTSSQAGGGIHASTSDLATLYLGTGIALLIALLAWGDQIQGLRSRTKELQSEFLDRTGVDRGAFSAFTKGDSPAKRLEGLNAVVRSANLRSGSQVKAMPLFRAWFQQLELLNQYSKIRFWLAVALCASTLVIGAFFLGAGALPAGLEAVLVGPAAWLGLTFHGLAALQIAVILALTILIGKKESEFAETSLSIEEVIV